jgi:hypothetical protein
VNAPAGPAPSPGNARKLRAPGLLALACFAAHAVYHISRHETHDLLWTCNFACLVVALSCLANYRDGVAVGVSWLSVGIPLWILDLGTGGEFVPTSALTHLGGYAAGLYAIRLLRWPPGVWWKATATQLTLILVTRLLTPPRANVNLAFAVWPGWERYFPTFGAYFFLLFAASLVTYLAVDRTARKLLVR